MEMVDNDDDDHANAKREYVISASKRRVYMLIHSSFLSLSYCADVMSARVYANAARFTYIFIALWQRQLVAPWWPRPFHGHRLSQ